MTEGTTKDIISNVSGGAGGKQSHIYGANGSN